MHSKKEYFQAKAEKSWKERQEKKYLSTTCVFAYIISCLSYNSVMCWKIQERVAWRSLWHTQ